jgi:hypothetical protein
MENQFFDILNRIQFVPIKSRASLELETGINFGGYVESHLHTIIFNFHFGNSFVGAMLSHLNRNLYCLNDLEHPYWHDVIHHAQNAAIRTLQSHDAVGV